MYDVRYTIYDIRYKIYDIRYKIYDIRYTIYDIQCTIYDIRYTALALCFKGFTKGLPRGVTGSHSVGLIGIAGSASVK